LYKENPAFPLVPSHGRRICGNPPEADLRPCQSFTLCKNMAAVSSGCNLGTLNPWPRPGSYTNSLDLTVASVWWYSKPIQRPSRSPSRTLRAGATSQRPGQAWTSERLSKFIMLSISYHLY